MEAELRLTSHVTSVRPLMHASAYERLQPFTLMSSPDNNFPRLQATDRSRRAARTGVFSLQVSEEEVIPQVGAVVSRASAAGVPPRGGRDSPRGHEPSQAEN